MNGWKRRDEYLADAALKLAGNLRDPQPRVLGGIADRPLRAELLRQEARLACTQSHAGQSTSEMLLHDREPRLPKLQKGI